MKFGGTIAATKLTENFCLGLTDPTVNSPCLDADGAPSDDASLFDPAPCGRRAMPEPRFSCRAWCHSICRAAAASFSSTARATIKQQAVLRPGRDQGGRCDLQARRPRCDHYDGLTSKTLVQPRLGVSYAVPGSAHRSSRLVRPDAGNAVQREPGALEQRRRRGLRHRRHPLPPGTRDQVEVGVQQGFGRWVVVDVGYFYKHTTNAYDFGALFDTPIFFPVSWDHSKLDGFTGRINLVEHGGFSAFTVMGAHQRDLLAAGNRRNPARGAGRRLPHRSRPEVPADDQPAVRVRQGPRRLGGVLVALRLGPRRRLPCPTTRPRSTLTADQQAAIGLFCGSTVGDARRADHRLRLAGSRREAAAASRPDGTEDDLDNPPRIAPRNLFDLGLGVDNLLHGDRAKFSVRFSVVNLTNKEALYNFLSTFSGTHFVTSRAVQVQAGVTF